ncbi:MAG: hypothetical protein AAF637_25185 [Pseudomonadota bacterium]
MRGRDRRGPRPADHPFRAGQDDRRRLNVVGVVVHVVFVGVARMTLVRPAIRMMMVSFVVPCPKFGMPLDPG